MSTEHPPKPGSTSQPPDAASHGALTSALPSDPAMVATEAELPVPVPVTSGEPARAHADHGGTLADLGADETADAASTEVVLHAQHLSKEYKLYSSPRQRLKALLTGLEASIVEFAGLGDAMNRPVKTYSSGMVVRLAFALVTAVQPDVLIVDEALAVGDQSFQKKCIDRIRSFREAGCTILFCSHSPYHVRSLCDVAMWLERGQIREFGSTEAVLSAYERHERLQAAQEAPADADATDLAAPAPAPLPYDRGPTSAMILSCEIADLSDGKPGLLGSKDLVATITVRGKPGERPNIGFMIEQDRGVGITSLATHEEGAAPVPLGDNLWRSVLSFPNLPLNSGDYELSVVLFDETGLVTYDLWFKYTVIRFVSPTLMPGLVRLPHHWG